ncbi:anti-anti-sigma factor [Pseudonocardia sp. MH-G8]|nr:anti-anti-sigma factor [Pseudonocardia sp. MH-G8]
MSSTHVGDAVVVSLTGVVDMLTAPRLLPAVDDCVTDGRCTLLAVDLRQVTFLASAGLVALMDVREFAEGRGLPFRVVTGDNRRVLRPFEITGIGRAVTVCGSMSEALSAPGRSGS